MEIQSTLKIIKLVIKNNYAGIFILTFSLIAGCVKNNSNEPSLDNTIFNNEKCCKQRNQLLSLSKYIAKYKPLFFDRSNGSVVNDSIKKQTEIILANICPNTFESIEFNEFVKIFILTMYFNDLKYCHQSYDLKEQFKNPYSIILKYVFYLNKIDYEKEEIFTSDEILKYNNFIDSNKTDQVSKLLIEIDSISKDIKAINGW